MNCDKKVDMVKGISNLKAHLDYSEDLAQSCENLNFCFVPKKNCSTDLEASKISPHFFEKLLIFLSSISLKTNGKEN